MEPDIFKMDGTPVLTKEQKSILTTTDLITGILVRENFTISQVYEVLRNVERKVDDVKFIPPRNGSYE